jgi:RNA polymerase sigma factor (sigma-70 family)
LHPISILKRTAIMETMKSTQPLNGNDKALKINADSVSIGLDQGLETECNSGIVGSAIQHADPFEQSDELALQDLIVRVVQQDQSAFVALFKAMSGRVYSLALRITGSIQLAEEVTEDVFFQVWRQAPRFDPARGTAKTWMLTIARSRALDARRSIPPFDELTESETDGDIAEQNPNDLPDLLSAIEQTHYLHNALESLESLPRQLIGLSFFKGLSHEEISIHADLPLGTVKSHLRRAIICLREVLTTQTSMTNQ